MAKHDIVLLNTTSSGFETDLLTGGNTARIKGDASSVFAVKSGSGESVFSVGTSDTSVTFLGHLTASGHITGSASSTASFGRVDVDFLTGDASQMTFVDERTHVSSSAQLAKRISGAFDHGFESTGDISGSITSTGSFGLVYANSYSGDASQTTGVNEDGHFSGSAQFATRLSGSFTSGINFAGGSNLSGSATSTGSFSRVVFSGVAAGDASGITINQNGFISSSKQIASQISGSFNKGFGYSGLLGTETPTLTTTQSIKLDESDDFLKINPIFVSGSEGDDKLYGERRFTFSMWLKFNGDNGSRNTFIMAGAQSGPLSGMYLYMQSNSIRGQFKIKQGSTMQSADLAGIGGIEIGKWHHLLLSYESNRPTPNVSGSFLTALDGRQKTFEVMQSGSYITTSEPPGGGSTIGTYNGSSENTNMTIADITMWKHSIQSASSDAGITSGSLITTLFNHGIVPDYNASFSTDYPDAYREKLKFAFNFDSSSYAGSSYSMYDRTGNTGFPLTSNNVDEGKIVSGSGDYPTEGVFYTTASFGRVDFSGTLTGDASQMTNVPIDVGTLSGSAQIESQISGSFNKGFEFVGSISGSANSTGSFSLLEFSKLVTSDVSGVTNAEIQSVPNLLSSSAQISDRISGSFQSGFASWNYSGSARTVTVAQGFQARATSSIYGNKSFTNISHISGSATSTASFAFFRSDNYDGDGSEITNLNDIFNPVFSGSFHIASRISGSFTKGFTLGGSVSGSADSTGSFSRIVGAKFDSFDATSVSGITNVSEVEGAVSGAAQIASYVSGSFNKGFNLNANSLISGSVKSTGSFGRLEGIATLNVTNFENVELDAAGNQAIFSLSDLSARISGAIEQPALSIGANFSGSNNSTASLQHIEVNQIETKELEVFRRLDASGSFIGTQTFKPFVIPTRGRVDHTMVTKQFIATGSMESQKYRNQAGQLFVDNWGRLNMTVQTGSLVAQPAAWTLVGSGEALGGRSGGMIAQGTKSALVLPSTGMDSSCTRIFDGITVAGGATLVRAQHHCGWSHAYQGIGNGVDDALFAGGGFGGGMGYHSQIYNGNAWSMSTCLPQNIYSTNGQPKAFNAPGVTTGGGGGIVGGTNRNKVYEWTGVSWEIGGTRNVNIGGGGAAGTVYAGLAFGGKEYPSPAASTCTEEYNGVSWATAASMPHELDTVGAGTQNAAAMAGGGTVSPHTHGPFGASDDTFEYNGTAWSTSVDMLSYMTQQTAAGGTGTLISGPGLHGWSNSVGAIFEPGFITGSNARTACNYGDNAGALYEPVVDQFSKNTGGKYLLTKKLQANASPSVAGLRDSGSSDGYGGGY